MKVLWFFPPSPLEGKVPLAYQNRWFKYLPNRTNAIYPTIAAYGATLIKNYGCDIDFLDCLATPKGLVDIGIQDYDIVLTESKTPIMPWLWRIREKLKEIAPNTKFVLYGDHAMCRPQESLDKGIDYVINCGDYDYGAFKLVEALDKGEVVNRDFRYPNLNNLDNLPFADRILVPWQNYWETWRHREKFGWYQSSRGCWAKCTYCSWTPTFYNYTHRSFSVKRIVDEIEFAAQKYGIEEFLDDADTFIPRWGVKFAQELEARGMDILWDVQERADTVLTASLEDWKLMRRSGLRILKIGVDGGSDYTFDRTRKGYNMKTVEACFKLLKKAGLEIHLNMVMCFPWETEQDVNSMIKWVKKLRPNQAQFSIVQPFIGTPIYQESIDNNWFQFDPSDYERWDATEPIIAEKMTAEQIKKMYRKAWKSFYFSPAFIARQLAKSLQNSIKERNIDSFRHLWRGYKGVKDAHARVMEG